MQVLGYLKNHKELGIHTEMFSDGVKALVESGVITNSHKASQKGLTTAGALMDVFSSVHTVWAVWAVWDV